jgi:general secretion pathway protein L
MSNKLMIRYDADDFARWSWVSLDKENRPVGDVLSGDLTALAQDAEGKKLVLVLAARSLLLTSVELPDGNVRTISSAIPYAMEEQLAEDVESMHFASGKRQPDGTIPVIATTKESIISLLQLLADAGMYPTSAVAEPLLLPWKENELSIFIRGNSAIVRDGNASGYECSTTQLPTLLDCLEMEPSSLQAIRVWQDNDDIDIGSMLGADAQQLIIHETAANLERLAVLELRQPHINVLQGLDAIATLQKSSGSWKPAIALSLVTLFLYFGTSIYQYYSLQHEIKAVTQNTEELFRKTFPEVRRLVQPLLQAQQKLDQRMAANGQATDDLLALLLVLGEAKQKSGNIKLKDLEYRQNTLVVNLEGASVAQIEKFKQQLEASGAAEPAILSTVAKGKRVEARIKLKAGST